jgi:epoxyqueuosine reductase
MKGREQRVEANLVKQFAMKNGADLVGVASVDRFAGAPQGHKPEDFLTSARSVVAMARRIPLAIVKKIPSPYYQKFGYNDLNAHLRELAYKVALFLEDQGYEAFPLDPSVDERAREVEILQEAPEPLVKILGDFSHRHAIVQAGLGEISAGCMVVVPKFGPRVRLVSVITTAPLEPDPKPEGKSRFNICQPEACGLQCARKCPAKALPGDGTVNHFRCRQYRDPALYTLEFFRQIAESKKTGRASAGGGRSRGAAGGGLSCGICIKACPIGIPL